MKKQFSAVILVLFFSIFTSTQLLFAYYPCEFSHPGETGNCEGCGDLSPTDCHRDCIQGFYGYDCSQVKKNPVCALNTTYYNNNATSCSCPTNTVQDFLYGGVGGFSCTPICQMNVVYSYKRDYSDRCRCPVNTTTIGVSTMSSSQLDSFKCIPYNPNPSPNPIPQPEPITYCLLNQEYSFAVTPYIKQCVCPVGSTMRESDAIMIGVHRFSCVSSNPNPSPNPAPVPTPIAYCELNKQYSFRIYPAETACTCPTNSNLVRPNWPTGTNSFTCVQINVPTPIAYCEINKSYFYNFSQTPCTCPTDSYKVVQNSYGYTGGQSFTCVSNYQPQPSPAPVIMQTCWNGTIIPSTSSCPNKPTCSYNQYWSGYSCVDYYEPYHPVTPYVDQYPFFDSQYYNQPNYIYDTYDWSTNYDWNSTDWGYSN